MCGKSDHMWPDLSLSTLVLYEGSTEAADTDTISGSHKNVVLLATDQVTQCAVEAGAAAGEGLSIAGGFHSIGHCICTGCPGYECSAIAKDQLTGHIRGRTWLYRGKQLKHTPLLMIFLWMTVYYLKRIKSSKCFLPDIY